MASKYTNTKLAFDLWVQPIQKMDGPGLQTASSVALPFAEHELIIKDENGFKVHMTSLWLKANSPECILCNLI